MATLLLDRATKSRKEKGGSRKGKNNSNSRFVVPQLCIVRGCHFGLASIRAPTDLHGKQNGVTEAQAH